MPSPSYDDRLIAMFDSYCKEVSRNYIKDLVRKNERRGKYVSHEPVDYLLELLGHEDAYPSHAFMLEVDGYAAEGSPASGFLAQPYGRGDSGEDGGKRPDGIQPAAAGVPGNKGLLWRKTNRQCN